MLKTRISAEEFLAMALAPENADRRLERIDGEIVEVVSNNQASRIAARIITFVNGFALPRNLGEMTGADGGYTIGGEQYIPDCAFVSLQRQPRTTGEAYPEIAPDLVVEVLSPGNTRSADERAHLTRKVGNYLSAGCEGFFGVFKKGMKGVYQHCSEKHLARYVDEFAFRHNTRQKLGFNDLDRAELIIKGAAGKRLTYRRTNEAYV